MARDFLGIYGSGIDKQLSSADRLNLFTTEKRKEETNNAVEWFVMQTECVQRYATIALADNASSVNLRTAITDEDFLFVAKKGARIAITRTSDGSVSYIEGREFKRTAVEILARDVPGWRAETKGTPRAWYVDKDGGEQYFGIFPPLEVRSGYTAALILPYVVRPAQMVDDTDIPFTVEGGNPDLTLTPWYDAIEMKAASELELLRKDSVRSERMEQRAMGRVMDYLDKQRVPGGKRVQQVVYRGRSRWQGPRAVRETETT